MDNRLIAWYKFDDANNIGKDNSGNGNNAVAMGAKAPKVEEICGRPAAHFNGGEYGVSYLELPKDILKKKISHLDHLCQLVIKNTLKYCIHLL